MTRAKKTKKMVTDSKMTTTARLFVIIIAICGGFLIESTTQYLVANYHWTISQPLSSALYSALCVSLFFLFSKTYSKRIGILCAMAGICGMLLLVTLNGTVYTLLNGFIWGDSLNSYLSYSIVNIETSLNFKFLYRLVEVLIIVRTLWDARNISWIRNSAIYTRIRMYLFGDKDSFQGVA